MQSRSEAKATTERLGARYLGLFQGKQIMSLLAQMQAQKPKRLQSWVFAMLSEEEWQALISS